MTEAYRALQKWAQQHADRQSLLTAHNRLTTMLALMGQQRESNELLLELLDALPADGSTADGSTVLVDLAERRRRIYSIDSETREDEARWAEIEPPLPAVDDAVAQLRQTLGPLHAVLPLIDYGWILRIQGQLDPAARCLEAAIELATETAQRALASTAYHQLAVIARMRGDEPASRALNEQSIALNRQTPGTTAELASMWPRIASAFQALRSGQPDDAERRLRRVVTFLGERDSFRSHRNSANIGLGLVALERGELVAAKRLLGTALVDSANLYPYTHVHALLGLARIARREGDAAESATLLRRALRFAGQRSLIEEYVETVQEIVRLQPAEAPIERLWRHAQDRAEAAGLGAACQLLRAIQPEARVTESV
jgi:tetratricopeptide (TPR) repeat protein